MTFPNFVFGPENQVRNQKRKKIMSQAERLKEFKKSVRNKFEVYNSLFLNLPYTEGENVGILIPFLFQKSEEGLQSGMNPAEILDAFFRDFTKAGSEKERIDLMFRIIQYVERQVVLYDSAEDAAFPKLHLHTDSLSIRDFFQLAQKDKRWEEVAEMLDTFSARIVLTAHPTQFYTPAAAGTYFPDQPYQTHPPGRGQKHHLHPPPCLLQGGRGFVFIYQGEHGQSRL